MLKLIEGNLKDYKLSQEGLKFFKANSIEKKRIFSRLALNIPTFEDFLNKLNELKSAKNTELITELYKDKKIDLPGPEMLKWRAKIYSNWGEYTLLLTRKSGKCISIKYQKKLEEY